eukprot:TRINITY_DN32765_c0_g1_i1.p3 TRINITY_DN32765_c0_g1~~TRINITY_DN32765_c0_g1_i1.p3  ORF type:complete len:183 (+),score=56.18 TRINITY_DN32765_c0_g1_i1:776-1324(+)
MHVLSLKNEPLTLNSGIWEGTTNVLSLDVLRVMGGPNASALPLMINTVEEKIAPAHKHQELQASADVVMRAVRDTLSFAQQATELGQPVMEAGARSFAFSLARIYTASLLIEQAMWSGNDDDIAAAKRWVSGGMGMNANTSPLSMMFAANESELKADRLLGLAIDPQTGQPTGFGDQGRYVM